MMLMIKVLISNTLLLIEKKSISKSPHSKIKQLCLLPQIKIKKTLYFDQRKYSIQNRRESEKICKQTSNVLYIIGDTFNSYFRSLFHTRLGTSKNSGGSKQQFCYLSSLLDFNMYCYKTP